MVPPPTPQPLHSILLVIKTRSGPRLVLHYPPSPDTRSHNRNARSTDRSFPSDNEDHSSASSTYTDDEEDALDYGNHPSHHTRPSASSHGHSHNSSRHDENSTNDTQDSGLEFGSASADSMARLLAPSSRGWDRKRFELSLEGRTYLACPMFETEEGGWGRKWGRKRDEDVGGVGGEAGDEDRDGDKEGDGEEQKGKDKEDRRDGSNGEGSKHEHKDGEAHDDAGLHWTADESPTSPSGQDLPLGDDMDSPASSTSPQRTTTTIASTSVRVPLPPQSHAIDGSPESDGPTIPASFATTATSESYPSQTSSGQLQSMPQTLTMFNMVFVLEPGGSAESLELSTTKEIYANVVRKFAKALRWSQRRCAWVWVESRNVVGIREKHKDRGVSYKAIWPTIAAKSGLARAVATVYECIRKGEIAHLTLGPPKSPIYLSLQIPKVMSTSAAPSPMLPQPPGLFTSTYSASIPADTDDLSSSNSNHALSPHTALLLLVPPAALLAELATTGALTSSNNPLVTYIRSCVPTKTLQQISRRTRIPVPALQAISTHLIHWRRAIAIPPLHASHIYVVNPNADFTLLPAASAAYAKRFPTLPYLVTMLSKLSGHGGPAVSTPGSNLPSGVARSAGPQPYGALIPSSDHKDAYMGILEWLLREGWVSHLRTFAWVRIPASVKAAVACAMKAEADAEAALEDAETEAEAEDLVASTSGVLTDDNTSVAGASEGRSRSAHRKNSSGGSVATPAFSPRLRALLVPRASSQASSSSARTTVRISSGLRAGLLVPRKESAGGSSSGSARHSDGSAGASGSMGKAMRLGEASEGVGDGDGVGGTEDEGEFEASIVLSPHRADAVESRWLKAVGEGLEQRELREAWPKLVRHFDGKHALEEIALREGWKRKATTPMLQRLMKEEGGVLLVVRHW